MKVVVFVRSHYSPEIRECLDRAWEAAPDDGSAEFVVNKQAYRDAAQGPDGWVNSNLRTQFEKRLKKAGVAIWKRLFHSMRASRQTELERQFPRHVVCAWMGNSTRVAEKSYLLVTEDDYAQAIIPPIISLSDEAAQKAAHLDQKATQQVPAMSTQGQAKTPVNRGENINSPTFTGVFKAEDTGLEPAAPYGVPQFQ
jgi:hypothetical protein